MPTTAAIVVTYHPQGDLADRLSRIAAQVDHLIIVDNHSSAQAIQQLHDFAQLHAHCAIVQNDGNMGIAQALNQGFEQAMTRHATWALTMDQDTIVEPQLVNTLLGTAERLSEPGADRPVRTPAVIAANFIDSTGQAFDASTQPERSDLDYHEAHTAITSGSLVNVQAWQAVGGFREDFFIDSVDHDFCFRARQAGWSIIQSHCPLMHHQLGATTRRANLLVIRPAIANYAPIRRYYMTRNRVAMFKAHWRHETRWVCKELCMITADALLILLFETQRPVKLKAMMRGFIDGVLGRMGPRRVA